MRHVPNNKSVKKIIIQNLITNMADSVINIGTDRNAQRSGSVSNIIAVNMNELQEFNHDPLHPRTKSNKSNNYLWFVIPTVLIVGFVVYSFAFWNSQHLSSLNYPVDSYGNICYLKYRHTYPLLYIDLSAPTIKYRCVNECPSAANGFFIMDSRGAQILAPLVNQTVNSQLGGVCWSNYTQSMVQKRGLGIYLQSKQFLLNKFTVIFHLCLAAFILSGICAILVFLIPVRAITYGCLALALGLMLSLLIWVNITTIFFYRIEMSVFLALGVVILLVSIWLYYPKIEEASTYSDILRDKFQKGSESDIIKFIKCIRIPLVFTLLNFMLILLVLFQYVALASNENLVKLPNALYYAVYLSWYKYIFLFLQWLFISNLLFNMYQFYMVNNAYSLARQDKIQFSCHTFTDIVNIYQLSVLQTLLWLPLKFILIIKPEGAVLQKDQDTSVSQQFSKCCYCCCGFALNYLHKLSTNPFMVLTLQSSIDDLHSALSVVQEVYHRTDPAYDKTSLWLFRLSGYISISLLSIAYVTLASNTSNVFATSYYQGWFLGLGIVLTVEISQYFLNVWGTMTEVIQFWILLQKGQWINNQK